MKSRQFQLVVSFWLLFLFHAPATVLYMDLNSTNLSAQSAFSTIQNNIVGQAGTTSYADANAPGNGPYYCRVGVQ